MVKAAVERLLDGEDVAEAGAELAARVDRDRSTLARGLAGTAEELAAVLPGGDAVALQLAEGLFGADVRDQETLAPEMHRAFLRRVVAVDVVRRSFTNDDTLHNSQQISFAQLTPEAPDPIFSAEPFTKKRFPSVEDKLCGAILGHFGAFYRRSWRANDFMWGRLDASARIVEMLVGSQRSKHIHDADGHEPWRVLAAALTRSGPEQRELLKEALADLDVLPADDAQLEERLAQVLRDDLLGDERGEKTRAICRRAVQFEILCEELQYVVSEAAGDLKQGCSPATIGLDDLDLTQEADVLKAVRELRHPDCILPKALGRDSRDELTSDLAARTVAHAGLITLGVSRGAGGLLATPLITLRSALLPVSGAVSQHARNRLGVVAAFSAAALYLGARIAATESTDVVDARDLSLPELLLAMVALLVVAGAVVLPAVRAWLGGGWRRWAWGVLALLLLAAGGLAGSMAATLAGPLSWAHLLVAPDVEPPWYVTLLPIAIGTGAVVVGPRPLRKPVSELAAAPWRGTWSLLLVGLATAIVTVWAAGPIIDAIDHGLWWQRTAAIFAVAAIPLALIAFVVLPPWLVKRPPPRRPAQADRGA
jgi:hypothetical protein